jgi:hypothetical protein
VPSGLQKVEKPFKFEAKVAIIKECRPVVCGHNVIFDKQRSENAFWSCKYHI